MQNIIIKEKQRFKEIPFYLLIGIVHALFLWGFIQQVLFGKPWGINPASNIALIIINVGLLLVTFLLLSFNLVTELTVNGIYFRLFPFHLSKRFIGWSDIENAKVVKYDGIKEYLGWGLRYAPRKGWCYTISGNWGIRIKLKNCKTILIGTHKAIEFSDILNSLNNKGVINKGD